MTRITLSKAINHEGASYEFAEIGEPSVGGVEAYEKSRVAGESEMSAMVAMLSVDLGWPAGAVRKLKISDLTKMIEAVAPFVPAPETPSGPAGVPSAPTSPAG